MRVLVLSDIHANLTALDAVLQDCGPIEAVWCMGDVVGYGPDPNECIARLCEQPNLVCVLGNHDAAAINRIEADSFNFEARLALHWTQAILNELSLSFLSNLPEAALMEDVTLVHGSPRQPVWEYLMDPRSAMANFKYFETPYCFVGHTHLPVNYSYHEQDGYTRLNLPRLNLPQALTPRAILNPGSVGQPRDRDPRASYALYDSQKHIWEFRRVTYDVHQVQERMTSAGLPERHIQRLIAGW